MRVCVSVCLCVCFCVFVCGGEREREWVWEWEREREKDEYTLVLTFKPTSKMWGGMMWPSLETTPKALTVAGNYFHHPVICSNPDLHFEGAGNSPVVITWIGSGHELYRGASLISLVEHCVTFRHVKKLVSLLGFVHNWPTSRWSAIKKENRFSLNGNGFMSSFLGRQFYRSSLYLFMGNNQFNKNLVRNILIYDRYSIIIF